MRQQLLLRSVLRLVRPGEKVLNVAYMWARGWNVYLAGAAVFAAVLLVSPLFGVETWPARVAAGLLLTLTVVTALTEFRVLAQTDQRMLLCTGGRFRQVAKALIGDIDAANIKPVGGTMLATDWEIDGETYTVPKSYEKAINAIALTRQLGSR